MGDLLDLAREVVTLPGLAPVWPVWPSGYAACRDARGMRYRIEVVEEPGVVRSVYLPDLADPATLGCLLALVREAWGQDDLAAVQIGTDGKGGQEWAVRSHLHAPRQHLGWGEAHALVAALRAAGAR